ncbi:MAG: sulfatase-like hydrolase/transferase [Haliscomenobacter sp.]|nr:sulfatase-like hydrolase/transferase [Haliscomenobacter sp.]
MQPFPDGNHDRTTSETTRQFENAGNFREKPGGKDRLTLPAYLRQKGYETIAAGKIFHQPRGAGKTPNPISDPDSGTFQQSGEVGTPGHKQYLDDYDQALWMELPTGKSQKPEQTGGEYLTKFGVWGPIPQPKEDCGDWKMADFGARFLQEKHEKPFFLAIGISRPHSPQLAPQEYFDRYPLDQIWVPEFPANDMDDIPPFAQSNFSSPFVRKVLEKDQLPKAVQGYLASMSFADDCVGRVLDALDNSPYKNNTIVVFWTDHGWQLGHKFRWEKYSLWRQGTNTPLVIRYPGMKTGGNKCHQAVSLMDLFPTILDLLNQPKPDFLEGQSLAGLLKKPTSKRSVPAVVTYPEGSHSVVFQQWNYILYKDGSEELYNHLSDPNEYANLATSPNTAS